MRRTAHVCCASHHKRVMALLAAQCAPSPALPPLLGPRQHPPGPACRGSSAPSCGTARSSPPPALTPQRRRTQPAREGVSQHTGVAILSNRKISKLGRSCRAAVEDGLSVRTVTRGGTAEHAGPGRRCRRVQAALGGICKRPVFCSAACERPAATRTHPSHVKQFRIALHRLDGAQGPLKDDRVEQQAQDLPDLVSLEFQHRL